MTRLRMWALVLVLFALTAAAVAACALDRPASTWEELERIVSTYPAPTGYTVSAPERRGELCRRPDCEKPRVAVRAIPTEPRTQDELCRSLEQSLDSWTGFTHDEKQSADTSVCSVHGHVDGKGVSATTVTAAESVLGQASIVVSVWA